jgi:hypothetical protein
VQGALLEEERFWVQASVRALGPEELRMMMMLQLAAAHDGQARAPILLPASRSPPLPLPPPDLHQPPVCLCTQTCPSSLQGPCSRTTSCPHQAHLSLYADVVPPVQEVDVAEWGRETNPFAVPVASVLQASQARSGAVGWQEGGRPACRQAHRDAAWR